MCRKVLYERRSRLPCLAHSDGAKQKGQLKATAWPALTLDAPKRPEWGDLASTVAMSLASSEQKTPHDIAQIIVENLLQRDQLFDRVGSRPPRLSEPDHQACPLAGSAS